MTGALRASQLLIISHRKLLRRALDRRRAADWSDEAVARAQFHLSQVLQRQGKDPDRSQKLLQESKASLGRLLPLDNPKWLEGVEDDALLFDHLLTNFGARLTGTGYLEHFQKKHQSEA